MKRILYGEPNRSVQHDEALELAKQVSSWCWPRAIQVPPPPPRRSRLSLGFTRRAATLSGRDGSSTLAAQQAPGPLT
eukprot:scaffold95368_cov28-Tisochrysis_lutea.AAC.8